MFSWVDIALLHNFNKKQGKFIAHTSIDFPFSLSVPSKIYLVPPKLDIPRTLTLTQYEWQQDAARPTLLLSFEELLDAEVTQSLLGMHCLVSHEDCSITENREYEYLKQYVIVDVSKNFKGKIDHIEYNPAHPLVVVHTDSLKEILIPLVDAYIQNKDENKNILYMNLPKGLIEG